MANRFAHLVGSLPWPDARAAMTAALDSVGPYLHSLPDGETGERSNWIVSVIESLRTHPDLRVHKSGNWSNYSEATQLRVKRGRKLTGSALNFGHVAVAREAFPVFREVVEAAGRPDLSYQLSVPGAFDMAMFTLGPAGALRNRTAFLDATVAEIRGAAEIVGDSGLFQIEIPVELVLLAKVPGPTRAQLAKMLARRVTEIAAGAPDGTRFAVHFCLGDLNNKAYGRMRDTRPFVLLANEVIGRWPANRPLELLHAPFAAADNPATTDPAFYQALNSLRLPEQTRFAAGIAHESQPLADQQRIRDLVDGLLGREVLISAACGLGRRSQEAAQEIFDRTAKLCAG